MLNQGVFKRRRLSGGEGINVKTEANQESLLARVCRF